MNIIVRIFAYQFVVLLSMYIPINAMEVNNILLEKNKTIAEKMNIDTYTKNMIAYASFNNKDMFEWLKDNTNEENKKETKRIYKMRSLPKDIESLSQIERHMLMYKTSDYVKDSMERCANWSEYDLFPLIRLLVHQEFNVNYQWGKEGGATMLHFLVWQGTHYKFPEKQRAAAIQFLFEQPTIDINIQDGRGMTPLLKTIYDIRSGEGWRDNLSEEQVKTNEIMYARMQLFLDNKKVNINIKDKDGNTALFTAFLYKNDKQITSLIKRPDIDFTIQNNNGDTILHTTNFYDYLHLISHFSADMNVENNGMNISLCNVKNNEGNTPLHEVKLSKQYGYLLECKAIDVNSKNDKGETALHYSIKHPLIERYRTTVSCDLGPAIASSWYKTKYLLKDSRVVITHTTNTGKTLLHYAAKYSYEILKILIGEKKIGNLGSLDDKGRTALHAAALYHNNEAVQCLLEIMPSEIINISDNNGYSAFNYAIQKFDTKKEKWDQGSIFRTNQERNEEKTIEFFLASDKVYVPFMYSYGNLVFGGLVAGFVLFILLNYCGIITTF